MIISSRKFIARIRHLLCSAVLALFFFACADYAKATTFNVTVGPSGTLTFSPATLTIQVGDTLQWTWGSSAHTTTSGTCVGATCTPDGEWDSGSLNVGATFSHTFLTVGTFSYFCAPHGGCCGMRGTIMVTGSLPTPTPTPTPSTANTFYGDGAGANTTTGVTNSGFGYDALFSNTTGNGNTAAGYKALYGNSIGTYNTAVGWLSLSDNSTGQGNTATGVDALARNTTGSFNTANGENALVNNIDGNGNTAVGTSALAGNSGGHDDTAIGNLALFSNTTGASNMAIGTAALQFNTTGGGNTACGVSALFNATTASNNTAVGNNALGNVTTGGNNIALGESAGINLTSGTFNIDIGNKGVVGERGTIRIGKKRQNTAAYIAGITGATVAGGVGVIIDSTGHLGTVTSSARYKKNVQPMNDASEKILSLHPVTFEYMRDLDPDGIPQFGLVAEEVEKVDPDLVARDDEGKPYTVRYEAVNAMLLNEFLKEHRKVEAQQDELRRMQAELADLRKNLEALKK